MGACTSRPSEHIPATTAPPTLSTSPTTSTTTSRISFQPPSPRSAPPSPRVASLPHRVSPRTTPRSSRSSLRRRVIQNCRLCGLYCEIPEDELSSLSRCYVCPECRQFLWEGGSRAGSFDGGSLRAVAEEHDGANGLGPGLGDGVGGTGIGVSGNGEQVKVQERRGSLKPEEEEMEEVVGRGRGGAMREAGSGGSFTGSLRDLRDGIRGKAHGEGWRGHGEGRKKWPCKERGRSLMDIMGGRREKERDRGRSWTPPGWRRPWSHTVREWHRGDPERREENMWELGGSDEVRC